MDAAMSCPHFYNLNFIYKRKASPRNLVFKVLPKYEDKRKMREMQQLLLWSKSI